MALQVALARTLARFSGQYRDLGEALERNFGLVAHRLADDVTVSPARRRLIGAYFTQQYALQAAALFNPSIVPHPDQAGCAPGEIRFVLSLRAVGEGVLGEILDAWFATAASSEPDDVANVGHLRELEAS